MGSIPLGVGFVVLGLVFLIAVTCIILKLLNMEERADEREHAIELRKCERDDRDAL